MNDTTSNVDVFFSLSFFSENRCTYDCELLISCGSSFYPWAEHRHFGCAL